MVVLDSESVRIQTLNNGSLAYCVVSLYHILTQVVLCHFRPIYSTDILQNCITDQLDTYMGGNYYTATL